jgi:hypothetical protein
MSGDFSILGVGDVGAKRANLGTMFAAVRDELRGAPIVFGQLETVVSDRGAIVPNTKLAMPAATSTMPGGRWSSNMTAYASQ